MPQNVKHTIFSGMKPTNRITLGNYLGALKNWSELQSKYQCYFSVVDLHSITTRQDPKLLKEQSLLTLACYIASGIDPQKTTLFIQSHVSEHAELAWVLNCYAYMGELNRMTQFKDKSVKQGKNIPVGLFDYPVLMAADILLYDSNLIPVGEDQKQHIELTRDLAQRMNHIYGEDLFTIPEPFIPKVGARIMDLQDPTMKMGKSDSGDGGAIFLTDTDKQIDKKIKRATTDSKDVFSKSEISPGVQNLLMIQSALTGTGFESLVESYEGKQYGYLKKDTSEIVVPAVQKIRERIEELLGESRELEKIYTEGAEVARKKASVKLDFVYERVGFIRKRG